MIELANLDLLVANFALPFFRIAAMLMVAPMFGSRLVPARFRILMAIILAMSLSALAPAPTTPTLDALSPSTMLLIAQEIAIGLTMGFMVQMVFDAVIIGSQTVAMSMGLGFAMLVDPQRGVNVPILSQFFVILTTMMFVALNGHLVLISLLMESFTALPPGTKGLSPDGIWAVVAWGTQMFAGAIAIALPAVVALLIVNLAYGVISRAAPTLNLFAVGFPVTMLLGFVILQYSLESTLASLTDMLEATYSHIRGLLQLAP